MLGTTLWFVLAIGLMAAVVLDGAATFARAGVHAAADHLVETGMHDAVAAYQRAFATAVAADPGVQALQAPGPFSGSPPPIAAFTRGITGVAGTIDAPAGAAPSFTVTYAVTPTTIAPPSCAAAPAPRGDTIAWLQCNGFVAESRMSLRVTVAVRDAGGNELYVQRAQNVGLRLFAQYPYSAVVGREDAAADDPAGAPAAAAHEGDIGGGSVSGAAPSPWPSSRPRGGTLIHVEYACVAGAAYDCSQANPPDPDGDLHQDATWSDGNTAP